MKKKHYLLKFLAITFMVSELFIGIGIVSVFFVYPYAARLVQQRQGNVAIFVNEGTAGYRFQHLNSGFSWDSMDGGDNALRLRLAFPSFSSQNVPGRIIFGRFLSNDSPRALNLSKQDGTFAEMGETEGSFNFAFANPIDTGAALAEVKWPFIVSFLCGNVMTLAILELLSRLFRKVDSGEVFTRTSLRSVQAIGFIFIIGSILKGLAAGWLAHSMASVVMQHVTVGSLKLVAAGNASSWGFITGLVILALAEVFRQGLILKEETSLTI